MECENNALQILTGSCFTVLTVFCNLSEGVDMLMLRSVVPSGWRSLLEFIPCDFGWLGVWVLNPQVVVTLFILAKSPEIVCVWARENIQGVMV